MATKSIYIIGSLRNPFCRKLGKVLRQLGHEVFDDWHAAGPRADDEWMKYEKHRGRSYGEALKGHAAQNTFDFDTRHINRCDIGILVMPAGKSAHLELGWMIGRGQIGYVLFKREPVRWDLMYKFAHGVFFDPKSLIEELDKPWPTIQSTIRDTIRTIHQVSSASKSPNT